MEKNTPGLLYKNQTFEAREIYHHSNGSNYLSLYDNQGKLFGYINELGTTTEYAAQGPHQDYRQYVSIKGDYHIWDGFEWKKSASSIIYKNQTLRPVDFIITSMVLVIYPSMITGVSGWAI